MALPVLPAKYYLTHFFEFLQFLETHYQSCFEAEHKAFLEDFLSLSEDAQCVYVRMINRKAQVFSAKEFSKYKEIEAPQVALQELKANGFAENIVEAEKELLFDYLTKPELRKWLKAAGVETPASIARDELSNLAMTSIDVLMLSLLPTAGDLVLPSRQEELQYLLFLYFGKIQSGLNLYTLRDLGIRQASNFRTEFRPRFESLQLAKNEFWFSKRLQQLNEEDCEEDYDQWIDAALAQNTLPASTDLLKHQLLFDLGRLLEESDPDLAKKAWASCRQHPARERLARMLFKIDRKDEAKAILEAIVDDPVSEEELLFAEDFQARKFQSQKRGALTELLMNSREMPLSDAYFKKPEMGVAAHFESRGDKAYFTENYLWNALFGLLFWSELYESENTAIFNPFERSPADLIGPEFYKKHETAIEAKLAMLKQGKKAELEILKTVTKHMGTLNDIFVWQNDLAEMVLEFLRASTEKDLAMILRQMAKAYHLFHSGFPDLLLIQNGVARFIEVKAEGDVLRSNQLSKIKILSDARYEVEVLRVRWEVDPNQIYVVVDLETTGGTANFHRITEIGAVKIQAGQVIEEYQTLINPGRPIPSNITGITGITNEMVKGAPRFEDVADRFDEFTKGCIFVAHNARFDYSFIQKEYQRLDRTYVRPTVCTVSSMRKNFPGLASYSLGNLTEHFGIPLEQHHRALSDAKAAAELLLMINAKREEESKAILSPELSP